MNIYTYEDRKTGEVVSVEATSIEEADILYEKETGKSPSKSPNIGVSISFNTVPKNYRE